MKQHGTSKAPPSLSVTVHVAVSCPARICVIVSLCLRFVKSPVSCLPISSTTLKSQGEKTTAEGLLSLDIGWSMRVETRVAILVIFLLILVAGIVGNTAVVLVVVLVKTMRTTVNLCLAVLALADLGVLTLLPILSITLLFNIDASLIGRNFCLFLAFYDRGALVCSVLIFLFISLERYVALCHPLRALYQRKGWKVATVLGFIWIVAALVSIPYLYISRFTTIHLLGNQTKSFCHYEFNKTWMKNYEATISCLVFLSPVPALCYFYGRMIYTLQTVPLSEPRSLGNTSLRKSRAQVIKMLIAVVVIFVVCNVPFRVYILVDLYGNNVLVEKLLEQDRLALNWSARLLTYVNNSSNPIIYFSVSTNFRHAFRTAFCKRGNQRYPRPDSHSRRIYSTTL